ncbi:MAG: alkaline phosphatase D family protein [Bryobacterales bacterium]|nr:alkaline phosphatase D family protein [Bryobacterales bacterium]
MGFAPPEAYREGSPYPYFGSENPWDLRFFTEHIENLPQRRGQRQMLDIVRGRPREAVSYAERLLLVDPGDLESLFNLAVARAQLGQTDSAVDAMRRALDGGMPIERFVAGPRDILKPLLNSESFKEEVGRRSVSLLHGPMLGSVSTDSAQFWVRTAREADVRIAVLPGPRFGSARTSAAKDYTAVAEVTGLEPDTAYEYTVTVGGVVADGPRSHTLRTYPEAGSAARFSVAFGGGAGYVPENERMWDVIAGRSPLAFLFLGDNVYLDLPEMPNALHRYTYYRRQSRPEFRRLTASTSIYAIWDDHDSATDDVWLGPFTDSPPWKLPLFRLFQENWNNPPHGSDSHPGGWFSFVIADVEFFMLDCRFYRTNPYAEPRTMLGPEQKRWLFKNLQRSSSTFKVVASSVPWAFESKGDALDTWNGFRDERTAIFDYLAANEVGGVVLISADRHRSEAWRIPRPNGYALYEFESSRLTNDAVHDLVPGTLFGYNEKQSFGLLTFDMAKSDPTVTFRIVSIDDEVRGEITLKRSDLAHDGEKPEA